MPKIVLHAALQTVGNESVKMFHSDEHGISTDIFFLHRDFDRGRFEIVRSEKVISSGCVYHIGSHGPYYKVLLDKSQKNIQWGERHTGGDDYLSVDNLDPGDILTMEYEEENLSPPFDQYIRRVYSGYLLASMPHFNRMSDVDKQRIVDENAARTIFHFESLGQKL